MIDNGDNITRKELLRSYRLMMTAFSITRIFEENSKLTSKYVHATSRGHEAIQIAAGMQLKTYDWAAPYYRDDSFLLAMGVSPKDLMLQVFAKKSDPFSAGRLYYSHPSLKDSDKPKIPFQSSATGMQAIPATGVAMGIKYKEILGTGDGNPSLMVCSLGDASVTEGEVAEAFQMAALWKLPILYIVQDNGWNISAHKNEVRTMDADEYAHGFPGLDSVSIDGSDFIECYSTIRTAIDKIRKERRPFLIRAEVPLLNHHTSGVRMEWYRDDLENHHKEDPLPKLRNLLLENGISKENIQEIDDEVKALVQKDFDEAYLAEDPEPEDLYTNVFAPTPIIEEQGERKPKDGQQVLMVDSALHAIKEIMDNNPESLLYGQDVGARLGGVFREAATLSTRFGKDRVFNTAIQEAFIVGSTAGMSAMGLKPIVEVQFADYIWPGLNQLFTEVSRSCYLSNGKWPVSMVLRVPIGAYGSGGPYHSSSVESVVTNIRGIKIAYPSNAADMKGLMKAAYHDPNPVVIFEHKGLYWSKVNGTDLARTIEPDENYILPFGKANIFWKAEQNTIDDGNSVVVITYGMGVHWAVNAAKTMKGEVEVLDLRTLYPLDENLIHERVRKHNKCLIVTEEPVNNTFAQSLAARIQMECFKDLDAPVMVLGSENLPAIPLNEVLEKTMIPSAEKVKKKILELLNY